jgi:steroid delta-isomerase-like uncharacterized protein
MLEENKAIFRHLCEEFWVKGKLDVVDEFLAPDFVYHGPGAGELLDLESYKQDVMEYVSSCIDIQATVEDIVAEGDKLAVRYTWSGIHTGGLWDAPPTDKRLTIRAIAIFRIADGKIVDEWDMYDSLDMYRQLGLIPAE